MSGNDHSAGDGLETNAGEQSRPPHSSHFGSPLLSQHACQPHGRSLQGTSREGQPAFTSPGTGRAAASSAAAAAQQAGLFSPSAQFQERVLSPLGQRQGLFSTSELHRERLSSPTGNLKWLLKAKLFS